MKSACNPLIEDHAEAFYIIYKGDVPSIQCEMSLRWSRSMREVDGRVLTSLKFYKVLDFINFNCDNTLHERRRI
jgi:hypothetical protein